LTSCSMWHYNYVCALKG